MNVVPLHPLVVCTPPVNARFEGMTVAELDQALFPGKSPKPVMQGRLLLERKRRYELLHPETVNGIKQADSTNAKLRGDASAESAVAFTRFVRDTRGWSPRKTETIIENARDVHPDVLDAVEGSKLEKAYVLKALVDVGKDVEDRRAVQLAAFESWKAGVPVPTRSKPAGEPKPGNPIWVCYRDSTREVQLEFLEQLAQQRAGAAA